MDRFNPLKHMNFRKQMKIKPKLDRFTYEFITSLTKELNITFNSSLRVPKRKYEMKNARKKENTRKTLKNSAKN